MEIDPAALRDGVLKFIVLVLSLTAHEWGHAIIADKLGDDTPRSQGRVTLYPMAHIDLIGTILIPALGALGFFGSFAMIGWAKPVYVNTANFRRGHFDEALVTLAGPGVNVFLALLATFGMIGAMHLQSPQLGEFCRMVLTLNVALAVFNMLPIPPLDGSKFLMYLFGMSVETYMRIAMYGSFVLLVLINIPAFRQFVGMLIGLGLVPFRMILTAFVT
jgi:Zn-dependent protease